MSQPVKEEIAGESPGDSLAVSQQLPLVVNPTELNSSTGGRDQDGCSGNSDSKTSVKLRVEGSRIEELHKIFASAVRNPPTAPAPFQTAFAKLYALLAVCQMGEEEYSLKDVDFAGMVIPAMLRLMPEQDPMLVQIGELAYDGCDRLKEALEMMEDSKKLIEQSQVKAKEWQLICDRLRKKRKMSHPDQEEIAIEQLPVPVDPALLFPTIGWDGSSGNSRAGEELHCRSWDEIMVLIGRALVNPEDAKSPLVARYAMLYVGYAVRRMARNEMGLEGSSLGQMAQSGLEGDAGYVSHVVPHMLQFISEPDPLLVEIGDLAHKGITGMREARKMGSSAMEIIRQSREKAKELMTRDQRILNSAFMRKARKRYNSAMQMVTSSLEKDEEPNHP